MSRTFPPIALLVPFMVVSACGLPAAVDQPGETDAVPTTAQTQAPSTLPPAPALDKWSLWANGTQLRGANIWQRIVVPELDGPEFLGDEYVGPPITQADLDALADLGANVVNFSHPGIFTERPPYVLDEQAQANLDRLIEMAAQADLFVVITFRTGPGPQRLHLLPRRRRRLVRRGPADRVRCGPTPRRRTPGSRCGRYTAERYRDVPVVVGYDLMCEPNGEGIFLDVYDAGAVLPRACRQPAGLEPVLPRIVDGIRQVDERDADPGRHTGMGDGALAAGARTGGRPADRLHGAPV